MDLTTMTWSGEWCLTYTCECESVCVKGNLHAWAKGEHGVTCVQARSEVTWLLMVEFLTSQLTVQHMHLFSLLFIEWFSKSQLNIIHSLTHHTHHPLHHTLHTHQPLHHTLHTHHPLHHSRVKHSCEGGGCGLLLQVIYNDSFMALREQRTR